MAMKVKEFLTKTFEQMHFNKMPPAVRARFNDYLKTGDLVGHMADWKKNFMKADGTNNDLPAVADLPDEEWAKLYKVLQKAFNAMYLSSESFADNSAATKFLNKFFGPESTKLFHPVQASPEAVAECDKLKTFLESPVNADARRTVNKVLSEVTNDEMDLGEFIDGLDRQEYNTDQKFYKTLRAVLSRIPDDKYPLFASIDFDKIFEGFTGSSPNIADLKANYKEILETLHDKSKVMDVFKNYDNGKISGPLNDALKEVGYGDKESKDFIPEKHADKQNIFFQKIGKGLKSVNDNLVKPFTSPLRGTRRQFTPAAKAIIDVLNETKTKDGKQLKPTQGIKGIIENKEEISKKLDKISPNGREHFKWFTKQMEDLSKEIPDAYNGALKNPRQMRQLVAELIDRAVEDGKIEEAKSSMEILATVKYGIAHSRTVDALKEELDKDDSGVLSNKDLSWNKYGAISFVTKALDKTAKFALLGAGRVVAAVHNQWMRDKVKFRGKVKKDYAFHDAYDSAQTDRNAALTGFKSSYDDKHPDELTLSAADKKALEDKIAAGTITPEEQDRYDKSNEAEQFNRDHENKYTELMAYWDMLNSVTKANHFTLWASVMRKKFLKEDENGQTRADQVSEKFLKKYRMKYDDR